MASHVGGPSLVAPPQADELLSRLPRCTHLRPSTPQGSISPIHKTHHFEASIHYRLATAGAAPQILTIKKPVDFASSVSTLSPAFAAS